MKSAPCLNILRPYTWKPLAARNPVYLRFFHLARQRELTRAGALQYPRIKHDARAMRIPEFREKYKDLKVGDVAPEKVVLRGRIQSIRQMSNKLFFVHFSGEFQHVQGMCSFRSLEQSGEQLENFKSLAKRLHTGDIVSITGTATKTSSGELTIKATRLPELLSPSLVPLPHKLTDDETRIQQRHIDLLVSRETTDTLRLRAHIIKHMREFFHARHFLEFQTPIMAAHAGGAIARPFTTRATEFPARELALRIAPELWLKRLVVGGVDKVFEIGPSFRNEGIDQTHNPEFYTCEFYDAYASLEDLIARTEELMVSLAEHCHELIANQLSSLPAVDGMPFPRPFQRAEFIPTLEKALGAPLPDLSADSALDELLSLLTARDIAVPEPSTRSLPKLLDRLASMFIEPRSAHGPLFITHHPVCMSPLSKSFTCPATGQTVAARAELFVGGRELANMYEEENDPREQRRKFEEQAKYRPPTLAAGGGASSAEGEKQGKEQGMGKRQDQDDEDGEVVVDESYIRALESGLPPTGGWGCGIERLVMLFAGTGRISSCLSFGNLRNVVGLAAVNRVGSGVGGALTLAEGLEEEVVDEEQVEPLEGILIGGRFWPRLEIKKEEAASEKDEKVKKPKKELAPWQVKMAKRLARKEEKLRQFRSGR